MPKRVLPPEPYNCRRPPPPPLSSTEPLDDELSKRLALHRLLDDAFKDIAAPSDTGQHIPPSRRLYTSFAIRPRSARARDAEMEAWRDRWPHSREQDAQYLPLVLLLNGLGIPMLCRDADDRGSEAIPRAVGRAVHKRISERYREFYPRDATVCDGRVYFRDGKSERLSRLAYDDPYTVYGALNYCLAGQRNDIINIDSGEMWEIKPATLTSANLLQLWGYVDNYEVARVMAHYRGEPPLPVMRPGEPDALRKEVVEPFDIKVAPGVTLEILPFVNYKLPGLIAYTCALKRRGTEDEARAAVQVADADVRQVLVRARRDLYLRLEEEAAEARRMMIVCGVAVLVVAAVGAAALVVTVAGELGLAATGGALLEGAEGAVAAGRIIYLAEARVVTGLGTRLVLEEAAKGVAATGLEAAASAGVREATRIAASLVTIYVAGQPFRVPQEVAGFCIEAGCEAGRASTPNQSP